MMTLEQIAKLIDGTLIGDSGIAIHGVETIEGARETDLTFAVDSKTHGKLVNTKASAVLLSEAIDDCPIPCIVCADAREAFTKIALTLRAPIERDSIGISPLATISPTATIGDNVDIYPGAYIADRATIGSGSVIHPGVCVLEGCQIGADVTLWPRVVLYENTIIGDRSMIHANAVIGAYGFGYDSGKDGHKRSVQLGNVEIAADVEIGAGTTIDRGTFGTTRIGNGSKLDNQVQIGHNCQIGSHNLLCSQVGIAGSTETGSFVVMGGQVGVGDHLTIGSSVMLCAQSGVMHNLDEGKTYLGSPCKPAREQFQVISIQAKLPEMKKQLKKLNSRIEQLESQLDGETGSDDVRRAA